ncbi:MAG: hypothetical protein JXR53_14320 [Bacteroidales bacterium]|nr:hypothetical protein [Bacteroidales bacterium]
MKKNFLRVLFILFVSLSVSTWVGCGNSSNNSDDAELSDAEYYEDDNNESEEYDARIIEISGEFDDDLYVCESGGFKIKFPEAPEVPWDIVETDVGDIDLYSYLYELSDAEAYMVAVGDYPDELLDKENPYELLVSSREVALEDMDALIEDEKQFEVNGFPAVRTYAIGQTDNMYIVYQSAIANNRLFQIMMAREAAYPSTENVSSFLDSFEITMKK